MQRRKRLLPVLLAGILTVTGVVTGPADSAAEEVKERPEAVRGTEGTPGTAADRSGPEPSEIVLTPGTYAPGEILVCLQPDALQSAFSEEEAPEVELAESVYAASLLDSGEDLMDVSRAARAFAEEEGEELDAKALYGSGDQTDPGETVIRLIRSEEKTTEELLRMYRDYPGVLQAEPNYILQTEMLPWDDTKLMTLLEAKDADPAAPDLPKDPDLTSYQYAFGSEAGGVDVPGWNENGNGNAEGVVAVLDSGVDWTNPDLAPVMWDQGEAFSDLTALGGGKYGFNAAAALNGRSSSDISDKQGHGTHCAGIIAGAWNDFGISGAANGCRIMGVRHTFDDEGHSFSSSSIAGFNYILTAKREGVPVVSVNCSFGGPAESALYQYAVKELETEGVVTCFASGNDTANLDIGKLDQQTFYDVPGEITVNSETQTGEGSFFSNYGIRTTHIYAPGSEILSTYPGDKSGAFPDILVSPPAADVSGNGIQDRYDEGNLYFSREVNSDAGVSAEISDGMLKLKNIDIARAASDAKTEETLGEEDNPENLVVLDLKGKGALPELPEGKKYTLILEPKSDSKNVYLKVFLKTVDGSWDRPGTTNLMQNVFFGQSYVLGEGQKGGVFDLEDPEIRLVAYTSEKTAEIPEIDLKMLWITAEDPIPYHYDSGTSMATPVIAGEAAILAKEFPEDSAGKRAARILAGAVRTDEFSTGCITGGRANVRNSLNEKSYTPVIQMLREEGTEQLRIEGYFFGKQENLTVTLTQGEKAYVSGTDFVIESVDPEKSVGDRPGESSPECIVITRPEGLGKGEVNVTVRDSAKSPGRDSFSRLLLLSEGASKEQDQGFHEIPIDPESALPGMYLDGMTGLGGKLYFIGRFLAYEGPWDIAAYDPKDAAHPWTRDLGLSIPTFPNTMIAWEGELLILSFDSNNRLVEYRVDPERETLESRVIDMLDPADPEFQLSSYDDITLFHDGDQVLLFRTPGEIGSAGELRFDKPTEVWELDPWLAEAEKLGTLEGSYSPPVISSYEDEEGKVIAVIGSRDMGEAEKTIRSLSLELESVRISEDGLQPVEKKTITPEGGLKSAQTKSTSLRGCALKEGVFLSGFFQGEVDPETGIAAIRADNFFFRYGEEAATAGANRISSRQVLNAKAAAYDGKVYVTGISAGLGVGDGKDKTAPLFLLETEAETLEPYGDEKKASETDSTVKVKKLTLKSEGKAASNLTLSVEERRTITAEPIFMDPAKTTGVVFESENEDVVTVHPITGEVFARGCGKTVVRARCGNKTAKCTITVTGESYAVEINHEESTLKVGEMDYLEVPEWYRTGKESLSWKSSNSGIVSVNKGLITAKKEGKATITATWKSGVKGEEPKRFTCSVTVEKVSVPKAASQDKDVTLSVSKSSLKLNQGEGMELTVTLKGKEYTNRTILVRSANPDFLFLKENGREDDAEDEEALNPSGLILKTESVSGKKDQGAASVMVYAEKPGTGYLVVESFEGEAKDRKEATKVNRKLIKVTTLSPASGFGYFMTSEGLSPALRTDDSLMELEMKKGSTNAIYLGLLPEICTDAPKLKWSVKGSGVSVKNGVITAKSVTKEGKPAIVTVKCGKAETRIEVVVTE